MASKPITISALEIIIEQVSNKEQPWVKDIYANAQNNNVVAIKFSWRREQKLSASRTFVRLNVLDYKRAIQSKRQSVRIHSALCEVACEQLRLWVEYRKVVSNKQLLLYLLLYKLQTVGHINSVYNKVKEKLNTYLFLLCLQSTNSYLNVLKNVKTKQYCYENEISRY